MKILSTPEKKKFVSSGLNESSYNLDKIKIYIIQVI